ncbi:conserved hypothetical protein [Uncinocarpus reesii 1704]|uniref:Protein rds1 n=1 Tax=Uncinocarpus reesii (strain UAMH 1704) TaxID=336963 RepID=C4JFR0_UNCRE|nr:uncharacterized protein UREG_02394 [Uncinocarpus reesii 1704]EEP77545.1 conserved hypothetical protein [Uncinocarpus reesii 1704]
MFYNALLTGIVAPLLFPAAKAKPADLTYASGIVVPATPSVVSGVSLPRGTGPWTGVPTATGALTGTVRGTAITPRPAPPEATRYPSDGMLHDTQPAPYIPAGGLGTNGTAPVYNVRSDYDYQSIALLLYCDWLQLDMLDTGLDQFSVQDFTQAGLTARDRSLVQFMRTEVLGHITMLSNILGQSAPTRCSYRHPFKTLPEFFDFAQKISKVIESTAYGFVPHLDARETAQLLLQAVSMTGRQQLLFRQFEGLFPIPVWFQTAIPQSWAWTLIAPYINYCPGNNPRLVWQNYPALAVINQPNPFSSNATAGTNTTYGPGLGSANMSAIDPGASCLNSTCAPAISSNRTTPLSQPGQVVRLSWERPGMRVGPNNSYITTSMAGRPAFVAWVTQLNVTYSPLTGVNSTNSTTAQTTQPMFDTYAGDPGVNGTMFLAVTDADLYVTPFNLSLLNPHIVAGPAVYQAG